MTSLLHVSGLLMLHVSASISSSLRSPGLVEAGVLVTGARPITRLHTRLLCHLACVMMMSVLLVTSSSPLLAPDHLLQVVPQPPLLSPTHLWLLLRELAWLRVEDMWTGIQSQNKTNSNHVMCPVHPDHLHFSDSFRYPMITSFRSPYSGDQTSLTAQPLRY